MAKRTDPTTWNRSLWTTALCTVCEVLYVFSIFITTRVQLSDASAGQKLRLWFRDFVPAVGECSSPWSPPPGNYVPTVGPTGFPRNRRRLFRPKRKHRRNSCNWTRNLKCTGKFACSSTLPPLPSSRALVSLRSLLSLAGLTLAAKRMRAVPSLDAPDDHPCLKPLLTRIETWCAVDLSPFFWNPSACRPLFRRTGACLVVLMTSRWWSGTLGRRVPCFWCHTYVVAVFATSGHLLWPGRLLASKGPPRHCRP